MSYSANDELKELAKKLGFKCYIFDDKNLPSKLRFEKIAEIDAILVHKKYPNIILLVGANDGSSSHVEGEINKFFVGLRSLKSYEDISNLNLDDSRFIDVQKNLSKIKKDIFKKANDNYEIIIKKIFFAPCKEIDQTDLKKGNNDLVIDKDIYEYFFEVSKALDRKILVNDFWYLLKIKKADLNQKISSKAGEPAKSEVFRADKMYLDLKHEIIMYSLPVYVKDILEYVTVLRLAGKYDKKGFQRMIDDNRLKKINNGYLKYNNTFPNNIIILLNPEIYKKEEDFYNNNKKELYFLEEFNSLIVIDGQHRFFSFIKGGKRKN